MSSQSYSAKFRYNGKVAERYFERRKRTSKWRREQKVIEKILTNLPNRSSILDLPLGTGRFLHLYAKGNYTIYGLDISKDMLCQAQEVQRGMANVGGLIIGDAESIPLRDGTVDYVICVRLLNWAPLPVFNKIISELKRIARKGIIVEVRVTEPIGWFGMINKTLADPWTVLHRIANAFRTEAITNLKTVMRAVTRKASTLHRSENPRGKDEVGYYLHGAADVARILIEEGLVVRDVIEVDKSIDYRKRQFRPLLIMSCYEGPP